MPRCRPMTNEPGSRSPRVVNGWALFAHPLFLDQVETLIQQVETLQRKDSVGYVRKNASKRLAAMSKLAFEVIPQDPTRAEYRQGHTLGEGRQHGFRAKFFQQYRLFFRYHAPSQVIVYASVNDQDSQRAYESGNDAYRVFHKMLASGHPPDDWDLLLAEARAETARWQQVGAQTSATQP